MRLDPWVPLYRMDDDRLELQPPARFEDLRIRERQDLQAHLFRQIAVLGDDLKVVAQEFGSWEDARRRLDLLAIDRRGRLVVIELKRSDDGGLADLQAVRYAAMVSAMTFEDVVEAYRATLRTPAGRDLDVAEADAREDLLAFLDDGEEFTELSSDVQIVIVAADFGRELTTTALWLNGYEHMSIRCVRVRPYQVGSQIVLDVEQVIPVREAADYQVRLRRKQANEREVRTDGRDWTQYAILEAGARTPPLRKRWAILELVKALHRAGVPIEEMRRAIPAGRLLPVPGLHDAAGFADAFTAAHPTPSGRLGRWFTDDLIHDDGRTWVLSNQWGGPRALAALDRLSSLAPPEARISYEEVEPS